MSDTSDALETASLTVTSVRQRRTEIDSCDRFGHVLVPHLNEMLDVSEASRTTRSWIHRHRTVGTKRAFGYDRWPTAAAKGKHLGAPDLWGMAERERVAEMTVPSGTVTFLFSDIESSTESWARDRSAMQKALVVHDRLMRESIEADGGHVFKTMGDAFCAAFAKPESAVGAALAAQRALAAADF